MHGANSMKKSTELEVAPALESDIDRLMEVQFSAFEGDPYHGALYPGDHFSPTVRRSAGERTIKEWRSDPSVIFMKCANRHSGQIVGFAKWNLYEMERAEEQWTKRPDVDWCTGRQKEVAENFLYATMAMREKTWEGRPHLCEFHDAVTFLQFRTSSRACTDREVILTRR